MNVLINRDTQYYSTEEHEVADVELVCENIAIGMVVLMVVLYLTISIWSTVLLMTGNTESVGPIGLLCKLIHTNTEYSLVTVEYSVIE